MNDKKIDELIDELHSGSPTRERSTNPKLYSFLERELTRLKKLNVFISKKLPNLEQNPQLPTILRHQEQELTHLRQIIIEQYEQYHPNFAQLWNQTFTATHLE